MSPAPAPTTAQVRAAIDFLAAGSRDQALAATARGIVAAAFSTPGWTGDGSGDDAYPVPAIIRGLALCVVQFLGLRLADAAARAGGLDDDGFTALSGLGDRVETAMTAYATHDDANLRSEVRMTIVGVSALAGGTNATLAGLAKDLLSLVEPMLRSAGLIDPPAQAPTPIMGSPTA